MYIFLFAVTFFTLKSSVMFDIICIMYYLILK
jgi:hypothetical protein